MGMYEIADSFEGLSVKQRFVATLVVIGIVLGLLFGVYFLGKYHQRTESAEIYSKETQRLEKKVTEFETLSKVHDENELQLMGENQLLKKAITAQAEILKANDSKLGVDAKKLDELQTERLKKVEEIKIDDNFQSQVDGLCSDYKASGVKISFCK